jgi:hypothetical protein
VAIVVIGVVVILARRSAFLLAITRNTSTGRVGDRRAGASAPRTDLPHPRPSPARAAVRPAAGSAPVATAGRRGAGRPAGSSSTGISPARSARRFRRGARST